MAQVFPCGVDVLLANRNVLLLGILEVYWILMAVAHDGKSVGVEIIADQMVSTFWKFQFSSGAPEEVIP